MNRDATTRKRLNLPRKIVGGLFLYTGGIHLGIVAADANIYAPFAQEALFPFVEDAWRVIVMSNPSAWGLVLSLGEASLGVLLLLGGVWAKVGWVGVIAFHVALMLFGFGFWLWSVPALLFLIPSAIAYWRRFDRIPS